MAYGAITGQTPTVQASAEMTSYNNDNTSSVITADNVQGAIDQLFTSVSNGKSQIASAITGMGVSTSASDSFAQMATNIGNIETGPDWLEVENPAGAAQILAPYQTYGSDNKLIKGTITSKGAQTYTPKTVSQTIAKGQYLSGNQTIQGDENLVPSNIKKGVSIFGVSGTFTAEQYYLENIYSSIGTGTEEKIKIYFSPRSDGSYFDTGDYFSGFIAFHFNNDSSNDIIILFSNIAYGHDSAQCIVYTTQTPEFWGHACQLYSTYIEVETNNRFSYYDTYAYNDYCFIKT